MYLCTQFNWRSPLPAFLQVLLGLVLLILLGGCGGGGNGGAAVEREGVEESGSAEVDRVSGRGNASAEEDPGNDHDPSTSPRTVSGRLTPTTGSAVDTDVNDPNASLVSNNRLEIAQRLPNPVVLGGYVNAPRIGPQGQTWRNGDMTDWYEVQLLRGQRLYVQIQNPRAALDVVLYNENNQLVDSLFLGDSFPPQGEIQVENTGLHRIMLSLSGRGVRQYTAYNLLLGHSINVAPFTELAPNANSAFIPGELLIQVREPTRAQNFRNPIRPEYPLEPVSDPFGLASELVHTRGRSIFAHSHRIPLEEIGRLRARARMAPRNDDQTGPRIHNWNEFHESVAAAYAKSEFGAQSSDHHWLDGREHWEHLAPAGFASPELRERFLTLWQARELAMDPEFLFVEPNRLLEPQFAVPNDPLWSQQWNLTQIGATAAWPTATGNGAIVAVIDSGVLLDHPDLQGQTVFGYDFIGNISGGNDPGTSDSAIGRSSSFHGTQVAGIIAARTNNATGIAGAAHGAKIMPLRVCATLCNSFAIEQAVRFAARMPNASDMLPDQPADVINLSLGAYQISSSLQTLLNDVAEQGILIVAAAGNDSSERPMFPAALPSVLSVGATDRSGGRAYYSNFGTTIDLVAPGGDMRQDLGGDGLGDGVLSTHGDNSQLPIRFTYTKTQGTSIAAPHVAAAAALIKQIRPETDLAQFRQWLISGQLTDFSATEVFTLERGYGEINLVKAIAAAQADGTFAAAPIPVATPGALNFGTVLQSQMIRLSNRGGGMLDITGFSENSGGWLSITPDESENNTEFLYRVDIDRDSYPAGVYQATITFTTNADTVQVPVLMEIIPDQNTAANVGTVYVLLLDPETGDTVEFTIAERTPTGDYRYQFTAVEPGDYRLVAGSNLNNDGFICNRSDSCGQYPLMHRPEIITVGDRDLNNLDFFVGYRIQ